MSIIQTITDISVTYTNCTSSTDMGTLTSVVFDPFPPVINQNFTMVGRAVSKETVTSGKFKAVITIFGITIATESGDICAPETIDFPDNMGHLYYAGITCPLDAGIMDINVTAEVSSSAPDKTVKVKFTAVDQNSVELLCIDLTISMTRLVDTPHLNNRSRSSSSSSSSSSSRK